MTRPSGHERSYSMLLRSRAILFPTRTRCAVSPPLSAKYASICFVIGTSSSVKPSFVARAFACARDSALEWRYGVTRPGTFSGPSASPAGATVTALTTPPDTPTTARLRPTFVVSSRMKRTSILRTRTSSIRSGDGSFGSGLMTPVRASVLVTALERQPEAAGDVAQHQILALVAEERVAGALAPDELRVDLADEELLLELLGTRDHGAVRRDDLGAAPDRDAVLVADPVHERDVQREVLRVEAVHETARLRGAEVAAFGDAAPRARGRGEDDRGTGGRVKVRRRHVPEVLADRDAHRARGAREWLEAVPGPEVAAVVEDPVRRQVDLPVHVHEPAFGPVALRDVELRVRRALHEPGAHVEFPRGLHDGRELRVVGGTGHVGSEVFQVVAGERELGEHDKLRARLARARDPRAMHVEVPIHRAERRRALRDRDPQAQSPTRSRSRRSAYSCTSVQARSSSGASAYTLNSGRSASGSTRTHSPSFWCFTPSTCRVFSVCGSCASMRMTRPFCSQGQLTCRHANGELAQLVLELLERTRADVLGHDAVDRHDVDLKRVEELRQVLGRGAVAVVHDDLVLRLRDLPLSCDLREERLAVGLADARRFEDASDVLVRHASEVLAEEDVLDLPLLRFVHVERLPIEELHVADAHVERGDAHVHAAPGADAPGVDPTDR